MYMAQITEIKNIKLDNDKKGFTFTDMDGNEQIHRPESSDPNDSLWSLDYTTGLMWSFCCLGMEHNGYLCEYSEMFDYLSEAFTDECADKIVTEYFLNCGLMKGSKLYSKEGARGTDMNIADVTHEIKNINGDKAEIVYDVYYWDDLGAENSTTHLETSYTIPIVRTENGWRMEDFYRPY